jgi:glycosyltransferase involved in cell wall biosynthesis
MTHNPVPWLSILVPVYNVEPYLRQCVGSILSQTDAEGVETILLDDCSTDGSLNLCQQLANEFPGRVRVVRHNHNHGISVTRNSLLAEATGKFTWFLDSDDYLLPGAVARLKAILDKDDPDLVICNYAKRRVFFKRAFPGRGGRMEHDQSKLVAGVFQCRKMHVWLKIARRSLWDGIEFPVGKHFEDMATTPHLLLRAKSYYYAPQNWIYYRIRAGSIMSSLTSTGDPFNADKYDDIAGSLMGYPAALESHFGEIPKDVAYRVAQFVAKEYANLARRYHAQREEDGGPRAAVKPLSHYREKMEASSPMAFEALRSEFLKRGRLWDYFLLSRALKPA